jgi:ubiquinone/menaquinone biosynthesis C-methylase UbiE
MPPVRLLRTIPRLLVSMADERLARSERPRVPEPMIMDEQSSVVAFDAVHPLMQLPVYRFNALAMSALLPEGSKVLDLGSGSGRLLMHLAQCRPDVEALGIDLADRMLTLGRASLQDAGLAGRVGLRLADMTSLPADLPPDVELISTSWALHHLPTEQDLRRCLAEIARIREQTGCAVWIFDFARLRRDGIMRAMGDLSRDAPERLREDGVASERAAWSARELQDALQEVGLGYLRGDRGGGGVRHLQAYFAYARDRPPSAHATRWSAPRLPRTSQLVVRRLRKRLLAPA